MRTKRKANFTKQTPIINIRQHKRTNRAISANLKEKKMKDIDFKIWDKRQKKFIVLQELCFEKNRLTLVGERDEKAPLRHIFTISTMLKLCRI